MPSQVSKSRGNGRAGSASLTAGLLVFFSADELDILCEPSFARRRVVLFLQFPGIASEQLRKWERRLNAHFNACGCLTGAAFALFGLMGAIGWQLAFADWGLFHWPAFATRAVACLILLGGLGKVVGIRIARWRLRRAVLAIKNNMRFRGVEGPECQPAQDG